MQVAAVRTHLLFSKEPPHHTILPPVTQYMRLLRRTQSSPLLTSPTCQGYSLTSALTPPTILDALLARPHVQLEAPPPESFKKS